MPQRMPPELFAITPADASRCLCSPGRARACSRGARAGGWPAPSSVPGLSAHARAAVLDAHAREPAAHVDHDPVRLRLAVEARAAAAEVQRHARARARSASTLATSLGVVGHHDGRRQAPVGARVGGVADQVDRAR